MPMFAHRQMARWGTGDIGFSDVNTDPRFGGSAPWRMAAPARATSTVRDVKAGVEPAFPRERSIRHLHHQRRLSRRAGGKPHLQNSSAALSTRRHLRAPESSLCHRCPAHRLVPSGRPRALRPRAYPREPRDPGLPFRLSPGQIFDEPCLRPDNKKPSGAGGSGGFASKRTDDLLDEIAPMSRACAIGRRAAGRQVDEHFVSAVHCLAHVCSQTLLFARAREIRRGVRIVKAKNTS